MAPIMVLVAPNPWIEVNDKKLLKTLRCNPSLVGAQPRSGVCFCMWWLSHLRTPSERSARCEHYCDRPSLMQASIIKWCCSFCLFHLPVRWIVPATSSDAREQNHVTFLLAYNIMTPLAAIQKAVSMCTFSRWCWRQKCHTVTQRKTNPHVSDYGACGSKPLDRNHEAKHVEIRLLQHSISWCAIKIRCPFLQVMTVTS